MGNESQISKEFLEINAKSGLKGFDPENDTELLRRHYTPVYSQKEWDEYNEAKSQCKSWGEWLEKRSPKHEEMAQKWFEAYKIASK